MVNFMCPDPWIFSEAKLLKFNAFFVFRINSNKDTDPRLKKRTGYL
ncbi:MAG: hypothetical protein JWR54_1525 [Mucilaginibacter sp.]|nr:hypothetical protein [Mucilaginibacter sp.]